MKIHKYFCVELGKLRRSTVGDVVTSLGVVEVNNKKIVNLKDGLSELEQIFYTVDYLIKNELVYVESQQIGSYIPDFDPANFIKKGDNKYEIAQMYAMPAFLNNYWGVGLVVKPIYSRFVNNRLKTDEEIEKKWSIWIPIIAVILSSFLTALFTNFFTRYEKCDNNQSVISYKGLDN